MANDEEFAFSRTCRSAPCARRSCSIQGQELSCACGARVTFLLRGQEKSNPKRRPPRLALAGRPARQVREAGPGFSSGLLPARKGVAVHGNARCAASSSPPHRRPRAPEKQARIVRARSKSTANCNVLAFAVASARRSALLCRGPYGAAGGWRKVRQDGSQGCEPVFRRHMDVPSKNPVTRPRTRRAGCPEGAPSGCRFLLATSLLDKQKRSSSGADRRTKLLCRWR